MKRSSSLKLLAAFAAAVFGGGVLYVSLADTSLLRLRKGGYEKVIFTIDTAAIKGALSDRLVEKGLPANCILLKSEVQHFINVETMNIDTITYINYAKGDRYFNPDFRPQLKTILLKQIAQPLEIRYGRPQKPK